MKQYTTKEASVLLGVSIRTIQRWCKKEGVATQRTKPVISNELFNKWKDEISQQTNANIQVVANLNAQDKVQEEVSNDTTEGDNDTTIVEVPSGYVVEVLTPEEKQKLTAVIQGNREKAVELKVQEERIKDYQNQVEYLRSQQDRVQAQLDKVIETFKQQLKVLEQRQYIEAREKKMDT